MHAVKQKKDKRNVEKDNEASIVFLIQRLSSQRYKRQLNIIQAYANFTRGR